MDEAIDAPRVGRKLRARLASTLLAGCCALAAVAPAVADEHAPGARRGANDWYGSAKRIGVVSDVPKLMPVATRLYPDSFRNRSTIRRLSPRLTDTAERFYVHNVLEQRTRHSQDVRRRHSSHFMVIRRGTPGAPGVVRLVQGRYLIGGKELGSFRPHYRRRIGRATRYLTRMLDDIQLYNTKTHEVMNVRIRSVLVDRTDRMLSGGWEYRRAPGRGRSNAKRLFANAGFGVIAHELAHNLLGLFDEYAEFMRRPHKVDGLPSLMADHKNGVIGPLHLEAMVLPNVRKATGDANWVARWAPGTRRHQRVGEL